MQNLIIRSSIILLLAVAFIANPSCTKDNIVYVRDTVRIITHDTTKVITHDTLVLGRDSVKAEFVFTVTYPKDSIGIAIIEAANASLNVPLNSTYTWKFDGNLYVFTNQTYANQGFNFSENGLHSLSMTITCPTQGKTYSVVKTFTINLKG